MSIDILSSTKPQECDADLVLACQAGDREAFKRLYLMHIKRVYALCLRLSGDSEEAMDIAQEVFVKVWEGIAGFEGKSTFTTWLHRVTTNVAISHIRRRKSWWRQFVKKDDCELLEDYSEQMPVNERYLDRAIAKLPEQARLVFVLFAVEGYSHEEISRLLGIAVGSSKAQYFRARALLKEHIKNE